MKRSLALITALSLVLFFSPFPASAACNIAYNNSVMNIPNTATSPATFAFTTTGSDIGMVFAATTIGTGIITAVTFNGVSGTQVRSDADTQINSTSWFLPNVGAVAGTVSITFTTGGTNKLITAGVASYTCVSHSASVDTNATSHSNTGTTQVNTTTSVAANTWHIAAIFGDNFTVSAGSGTTNRSLTSDSTGGWFDNNAAIVAGGTLNTLNFNSSSSDDTRTQGVNLAPFIATPSTFNLYQFFTF